MVFEVKFMWKHQNQKERNSLTKTDTLGSMDCDYSLHYYDIKNSKFSITRWVEFGYKITGLALPPIEGKKIQANFKSLLGESHSSEMAADRNCDSSF